MKRFTEEFSQALKKKIEGFESRTSIEFVPVVSERSSTYLWPRLFYALLYSVAVHFAWSLYAHAHFHLINFAIFSGLFILFFALFSLPAIMRFILPKSVFDEAVEDRALEVFSLEEIFKTRSRTGVLVFISLAEHHVFILADKGLSAQVSKERWVQMGADLARDFAAHKAGDSFFQALDKLIEEVAPHFPPEIENPNELADHLRKH